MGKHAGLAHVHLLRERSYGQAFQAIAAGKRQCGIEDGGASQLPFAHDSRRDFIHGLSAHFTNKTAEHIGTQAKLERALNYAPKLPARTLHPIKTGTPHEAAGVADKSSPNEPSFSAICAIQLSAVALGGPALDECARFAKIFLP